MEFTFVTDHNQKSFTILAKVLRKADHNAMSIISRAISYAIRGTLIAMLLPGILIMPMLIDGETMTMEALLMGLSCMVIFLLVVVVPFFFSDYLTGFFGRKHMLPGTEKTTAVFSAESYTIMTDVAKTEYRYDSVLYISETTDYFVFVLGKNQGQIFSKSSISGGTVEDFRGFIEERTNKKLLRIKG